MTPKGTSFVKLNLHLCIFCMRIWYLIVKNKMIPQKKIIFHTIFLSVEILIACEEI